MATRVLSSSLRAVRSHVASEVHAQRASTDVLVLGCGIAGCTVAMRAAKQGLNVTMLTANDDPYDCNSYWAQGGIIYKAIDDTPDLLASDVKIAGAGRCVDSAVDMLANDGPKRVKEILIDEANVPFDRNEENELSLCLEASHNRARIIHFKDQTGAAITESMLSATTQHERVTLVKSATAVDLLQQDGHCVGAVVMDNSTQSTAAFPARITVLATGGLGDLYENTSNPETARGDGIAMANRVGANLANMEFVQFHPTTLYIPGERRFLLTEALRGIGATLLDKNGNAFAKSYHPQGELAPRDVVSRMITSEMYKQHEHHMFLDCSHKEAEWLRERFPAINKYCLSKGYDMTKEPLPVVPAAHYFCGGVETDLEGRTSVPGLYAAGEVACTGLHGANRLASTSLLEGLVWGAAIVEHVSSDPEMMKSREEAFEMAEEAFNEFEDNFKPTHELTAEEKNRADASLVETRKIMWDSVGVVRDAEGLKAATASLENLRSEAEDLYQSTNLSLTTVGTRNAIQTACLIAESALANPESVGTHFMEASKA